MIKTIFAFGALSLAIAAPATAQMAAGAALPMCSAKVHDSCQQGADNANAMTAEQAMKTGGVGDRGHDDAAHMGGAMAKPMHKHKMKPTPAVYEGGHNLDPTVSKNYPAGPAVLRPGQSSRWPRRCAGLRQTRPER